jgi:penicillin-binding protein 2
MTDRDGARQKLFTRRAALLLGGKVGLASLLLGRMYYLQVVSADQYAMLAEENRINMRLLPPPRGRILDRFGVELANNRQNYRVLLVPEQTESVEETLARLGHIVEINERRILRDIARQRRFMPVTVAENLTWEEFSQVNVNLPDLPGVQPDVGETRYYPYGGEMAHVVGYVSAVAEKELTGDPLLELPGFRIGKNGVEKVQDLKLRGKAGVSRVEVNAYGRVIRELARTDGEPGHDVVLTVDHELQRFITNRLGDESAGVVVMDVGTGDILALVSTPTFDPNAFNLGLSSSAWKALVNNPRKPLSNKAVGGLYPPGSTFKMVVSLAALESGIVGPGHRVFCNGAVHLGSHKFHCWRWKYGGHGWVDMREAIEQSCDVFFYEVARKIGVDRIAQMAQRLGLGVMHDIGLVGERSGLVPTRAWKQAEFGTSWQGGETLITGIGQGYLLSTPLQLAVMTARMVNGGYAVVPRLIRPEAGAAAPAPVLGIAASHLAVVRDGMEDVVNGKRGTARRFALEGDIRMAGKTGTAQVVRISKAERARGLRKNEDKPWEERDHGLFVAYAPTDEPRYACAVILEHGGGGTYAAEVARDIMVETLKRDPLRRPPLGSVAGAGTSRRQG